MKTHQKSDPTMEPKSGKITYKKRLKEMKNMAFPGGGTHAPGAAVAVLGGPF